jgi:hypothetical protein
VRRARATSRGKRSLRSTGVHLDVMDGMDLMDPEGEALHLVRKDKVRLLSPFSFSPFSLRAQPEAGHVTR